MAKLSLDHVSHHYAVGGGAITALQDISMDIQAHSLTAIAGPSGCGKSTLLRIISGLVQPTTGSVTCSGKAPSVMRTSKRIGFAFQDTVLLPWLDVKENIRLPMGLGTGKREDDRHEDVEVLLELMGLSPYAHFRPHQLSGGMKQRVALARALFTKPELLLLDEPFGALDVLLRTKLVIEISAILRRMGTTVLMVTHDPAEAILACDRVFVLSARPGRIVEDMTVDLGNVRDMGTLSSARYVELVAVLRNTLLQQS